MAASKSTKSRSSSSSRGKSAGAKARSRAGSRSKASSSGNSKARSTRTRSSRTTSRRGSSSRAGRSSAGSKTTTDHDQIRRWAEERGGKPSCVKGTGGKGDAGVLRIDFPGYSGGDSLQEIGWDEFFEKFEDQNLALLYQDRTKAGEPSNFNKLVKRTRSSSRNPGQTGRSRSSKR
jgi:hypothetical protein